MATVGEMKLIVLRLLQEAQKTENDDGTPVVAIRGTQTSAEILVDGVRAALNRISARVWKQSVFEPTLTEDTSVFDLPSDLISVESVFVNELKAFVPKLALQMTGTINITSGNAWIPYPYGQLTFFNAIDKDTGLKVYYAANWAIPSESDDEELDSPPFTNAAVALYATSHCLLAQASGSAQIRQFAQKVDAGDPLDIPAKEMSQFFMKRFELELNSLPMTERAIR